MDLGSYKKYIFKIWHYESSYADFLFVKTYQMSFATFVPLNLSN